MSVLRHLASAAGGAALAGCVFCLMGQATAPATLEPDWAPRAEPRPLNVNLGLSCNLDISPYSWAVASPLTPPPVQLPAVDLQADHPGFDIYTQVDPRVIEPELVVLSRRLSMTEAEVERRWWRSVLSELLED